MVPRQSALTTGTGTMWTILALCFLAAVEARPRTEFFASFDVPRIVNGSPASKGQFPFQLSLQYEDWLFGYSHTCGASLLSSRKALTAAHCTDGRVGFRVRAGATTLSPSDHEGQATVSLIREHPNYSGSAAGIPNDVCTLGLATAIFSGGAIGYATLASSTAPSYAGNTAYISGWGKISGTASSGSNTLLYAAIPILSVDDCKARMPSNLAGGVSSMHICVHGGGAGSCQGDSGGPMTHASNGLLIGVTSWGVGTSSDSCMTAYPSVYARVSYFRSWIDAN